MNNYTDPALIGWMTLVLPPRSFLAFVLAVEEMYKNESTREEQDYNKIRWQIVADYSM